MNKKYFIICLILDAIIGSLFTVLAVNMFLGDIINIQAGFEHATLFATLPAISMSLSFVLLTLYLVRTYQHLDCFKRISRLYAIILIALNVLGLIGCVLSAAITYKTLASANPFTGYLIVFMLLNILLIAGGVVGLIFLKKVKDDEGKIKINFLYVLKTIGWVFFILLTFDRFGTFLGMPSYIYLRNLYMTFPFYLWLLVPLFLGTIKVLSVLEILNKKNFLLLVIIGLGVNVVLFGYTAIMGSMNTTFVASLSPALPIERMISKPIEVIIHFLSYSVVGVLLILQNRKKAE